MTRVICVLVYNFKFLKKIPLSILYFKYKYILTKNLFYIMYIIHSCHLSHEYEQHFFKAHFQNP